MYQLRALDLLTDNSALGKFTYPRYRKWLAGILPETTSPKAFDNCNAVAACMGEVAIGLVIMLKLTNGDAKVVSVMVVRDQRRSGVATALLNAAVAQAKTWNSTKIIADFGNQSDRSAFKGLLASTGWDDPELLEFRLDGYADWPQRMDSKWGSFVDRLIANGFSVSPWDQITVDDRALAETLVAEQDGHVIDYERFEPTMDPAISIAIRQNGTLVGYIHGETSEEVGGSHYVSGYVRKNLQSRGWLLAGLDAVCKQQAAVYGPRSVAIYETWGGNPRMIEFMKRRLANVTISTIERYRSQKPLR